MAGQILKPQTNVPITGVITYVDFQPTKNPQYSDQIALRGTWDGAGEARIYLHLACEQDLQRQGIIGQRQQNGNYPLLVVSPRVQVLKTEQGTSKRTVVTLIGHNGTAAQSAPQQQYSAPQQTASVPSYAPQQGSLYPPQQQAMPAAPYIPQPSAPAQPSFSSPAPAATVAMVAVTVPQLVATFTDSVKLATTIITEAGGSLANHLPQVFETACALFSERCAQGLYGKTETVPF